MKKPLIKIFHKTNICCPFKKQSKNRVLSLASFALLLDTEVVTDKYGNEFVLLSGMHKEISWEVLDKTEFEAIENHVHVLDNLSNAEVCELKQIAPNLCKCIQNALHMKYPHKEFCVYATASVHDSFILRSHQLWDNESPYYDSNISYADDLIVFSPQK